MTTDLLSEQRTRRMSERAKGSRSVFDDLDVPNALLEEEKVRIAMAINRELAQRGATQAERAMVLGVAQPVVSNLERFELGGISLERLLRYGRHLGVRIEIKVLPSSGTR